MRYRQTFAEIDLDNLDYNLNTIHANCRKQLFCVVKANAYGHGAIEISQFIEKIDYVAYLCVSSIDEAIDLREAGITAPIINLGYTNPSHLYLCIERDITVSIISLDWLIEALEANRNLENLKCHIKVDTGMNRLGIKTYNDFAKVINIATENKIDLEGIFTHYHSADAKENTDSLNQLELFKGFLNYTDYTFQWIHIANSDALIDIKENISNAVRCGIAMYGYSTKTKIFKPVLRLHTNITQAKELQPGDVVSYSATYKATENMRIGILPIGYADGINRKLQNHYFYINDTPVRILGRICMDQIIIEYPLSLTSLKVEIIGKNQSCLDIANILDTIPYEVLTNLSDRITRRYIYKQKIIKETNLRYRFL